MPVCYKSVLAEVSSLYAKPQSLWLWCKVWQNGKNAKDQLQTTKDMQLCSLLFICSI